MATEAKSKNLQTFISSIKMNGLIRTNRYTVELAPPAVVSEFKDLRTILLYCSEVQLPGVNVSSSQIRTYGELREAPYERIFDSINMTFYVDNTMQVKAFFDRWVNGIQDQKTRTFNYYNDYTTDLKIIVEDTKDRSRYAVNCYECYPKTVSPIQIGYDQKDVMKLQVSMMIRGWTSEAYDVPLDKRVSQWDAIKQSFSIPDKWFNNFGGYQSDLNEAEPESQGVLNTVTNYFSGQ